MTFSLRRKHPTTRRRARRTATALTTSLFLALLGAGSASAQTLVPGPIDWRPVAPNEAAPRMPEISEPVAPVQFKPANPGSYAARKWAPLDGLVAGAQARGLQLLLTPTGPGPAWASRCKGSVSKRHTCKPNPRQFGAFVRALGKRYPTVKLWSIWNEPNLRSWLSPQYDGTTLQSAALYRALANAETGRDNKETVHTWLELLQFTSQERQRSEEALRMGKIRHGEEESCGHKADQRLEAVVRPCQAPCHASRKPHRGRSLCLPGSRALD